MRLPAVRIPAAEISFVHWKVPWPFPPLGSAERVTARVTVRTDLGESPWSEELQVETGLLDAADWDGVAPRVAPVEDEVVSPAGQRPAYELRGFVTVDRPMARARLYATAHGLYEVFLGGVRAGGPGADARLHPVRPAAAGAGVRRDRPAFIGDPCRYGCAEVPSGGTIDTWTRTKWPLFVRY